MESSVTKFFVEHAPVCDIRDFCELNGYYLEIIDPMTFKFERRERENGLSV